MTEARHDSKTRILDAAIDVFREKGYGAARIEDVCAKAGLTKGSFFHHFLTKEDLAITAAQAWRERTGALFLAAPYHDHVDPADRVLAYLDFRKSLVEGELAAFTCLLGTLVQEVYQTHPAIRDACHAAISSHAGTLVDDIAAARALYAADADWTAESLALYTQTAIQGSFIMAKTENDPAAARDGIDHLRRYIAALFGRKPGQGR